MARLIAAGAFAAVLPTGAWFACSIVPGVATSASRRRLAAAIAIGVGAWSILYAVVSIGGVFSPQVNGAVGWAITVCAGWQLLRERGLREAARTLRKQRLVIAVIFVGISVLAFLYLGFPNESLLGSRDEGIYTLTALALERTGSMFVSIPTDLIGVAPTLFWTSIGGEPFYLPGLYATDGGVALQYAPLVSAWIAQAHAACGDIALYRTSGLFALGSAGLFYAIAKRLLTRSIAFLCTAVFAVNPAQIWIARINLAEPLGQLLVLSALCLAFQAFSSKSLRCAVAAGVLFGLGSLVRLDTVLLAPLVVAAAAAVGIWRTRSRVSVDETCVVLALATVGAQAFAIAAFAIAAPHYVAWNQNVLWIAGGATLVSLAILALVRSQKLQRLSGRSVVAVLEWASAGLLVALFVYASVWRPVYGPFATISLPFDNPLNGQRDWREQSLPNLAVYLGWPTLVLGLLGAIYAVRRILHGRASPHLLLVSVLVVPITWVILANPRVSPDHFWAIRRFLPVVFPGVILLAGVAFQALLARVTWLRRRTVVLAVGLGACVSLLAMQSSTIFVRENRGITPELRDLAARAAGASIVIARNFDPIATTLLVGFGVPVAPLRDTEVSVVDAAGRAFWSRCSAAAPCLLLHQGFAGLSGLALGKTTSFRLSRDYIAPTFSPLPKSLAHETMRILMTPVKGLAPASSTRLSGSYRNWQLDDTGFYLDELGQGGSSRWTNGNAGLSLPAVKADRLEVLLGVPENRAVRTSIAVDRVTLHDAQLAPGNVRLDFPITGAPATRRLTIRSDTFVPNEVANVPDKRHLGVSVLAVRLLDSSVPRLRRDARLDDYRSDVSLLGDRDQVIEIAERGVAAVTLQIENLSDVVWPANEDVRADEAPVAIGIRWFAHGSDTPRLEQRISLPFSLHPGERLLLGPHLDAGALPPGRYEVRIGLVHEGVTWFGGEAGVLPRALVTIAARQ